MPFSLPRPVLLALAGLVLVLGAFMATRGSAGGEDASEPAAQPATAPKAPPLKARPNRSGARRSSARAAAAKADSAPPVKPRPNQTVATAQAAPPGAGKPPSRLPRRVERALSSGHVTVLFFAQRGPADDSATADAVRSLKRRVGGSVAVFTDRIGRLARYREIVAGLGVSRAPSIVIVDRRRQGKLLEGYVDAETLLQQVEDVRR